MTRMPKENPYSKVELFQPAPADTWVGQRIKARRRAVGMSGTKLAEILGLTRQQLEKYENGVSRITCGRLYDAAYALAIHPGWMFEGSDVLRIYDQPTGPDMGVIGNVENTLLLQDLLALTDDQKRAVRSVIHAFLNVNAKDVATE